jgi:hypothetical protein
MDFPHPIVISKNITTPDTILFGRIENNTMVTKDGVIVVHFLKNDYIDIDIHDPQLILEISNMSMSERFIKGYNIIMVPYGKYYYFDNCRFDYIDCSEIKMIKKPILKEEDYTDVICINPKQTYIFPNKRIYTPIQIIDNLIYCPDGLVTIMPIDDLEYLSEFIHVDTLDPNNVEDILKVGKVIGTRNEVLDCKYHIVIIEYNRKYISKNNNIKYLDNLYESIVPRNYVKRMHDTILMELLEKTMHPSRYFDWVLDETEKELINKYFVK